MTVDTACYRHPDRTAGVRCQRCERPICPSCMRQASVGFQCPECTAGATSQTVSSRQIFRGHPEVVVGKVLIAVNVAVYFVMVGLGGEMGRPAGVVYEQGAMFGPFIATGDWWRLISGAFLHANLIHLGMNMLLLWLLSQELEPALGRARFLALYATSLLGGSLGVMLLSPVSPTVGASGAVFGLMGGLVVLQLRARQSPWQSGIGGLVVLNVLLTFTLPGISVGGHLGGLLAGAAAGVLLQPLRWPQQGAALRTAVVVGLGMAFLGAALVLAPHLVRAAII